MKLKIKKKPEKKKRLSTGCTLLNLAISDDPLGGFEAGKFYYLVGDSTSGKTFFSMTCFAEACRNEHFKDYDRIYDNIEDGMLMDCDKLFGSEVEELIQPPALDRHGLPKFSETIGEFYFNIDDRIQQAKETGTPFIYVLDSMDGLDCEDDRKKFAQQKKAYEKGKDAAGTYGMGKAKANSVGLRKVLAGIRDTGSILIIISQTRDNVNPMSFEKKTRSGGKALKFYATVEIWTSLAGKIKKSVKGKQRTIGNKVKVQIKKNRITGKLHEIETAIYPSYGIDDIGSMIDYLIAEKAWSKSGQTINAKTLGMKMTRTKLIRGIESSRRLLRKLQRAVGACWEEIENQKSLDRRSRYS